jgi:hypothetical protein
MPVGHVAEGVTDVQNSPPQLPPLAPMSLHKELSLPS